MTPPWQRFLVRCILNFSIALIVGAVAFSVFSIVARADQTWVRRIGGAFFMFPLALLFGALIFWLPGLLFSSITSTVMIYSGRFSSAISVFTATILGLTLFPAWVLLWDNPLGKGWQLIMGIGGASALLASIVTQMITNTANKAVDSTATRVTPPASSLRSGQESRHGQP